MASELTTTVIRRRERLAWRIVLASFITFCLCVAAVPIGISWYLNVATSRRAATLDQVIRGTVLYLPAGGRQEMSARPGIELAEGDQIRTAPDSQALIGLFDGSNLRLWPETVVLVQRTRSSRYNNNQTEIVVLQKSGRTRVEVGPPITDSRLFEVHTPQATARLREGSYSVQTLDATTEFSARLGSASVTADERTVEVLHGERTIVASGETPAPPLAAARDYLTNGDFAAELTGWQASNRNVEDGVVGEVGLLEQDGRSIVSLLRRDSSRHAETYLHQNLDRDVSDFQSLRLSLEVKVLQQSLSGGGWLGSEYPLTLRLRYRDASGNETTWVHGFYIQNNEGRPTTSGQKIDKDVWVSYAADLLDPNQVYPRPSQLIWLEVEASGWQYESQVTNIQLIGE